ncbi:MAG: hypothetical protein PHX08_16040 [Lachnospiraceae bacterium]|nr:hypothetical protein [Lachnospiraceae bacterium]
MREIKLNGWKIEIKDNESFNFISGYITGQVNGYTFIKYDKHIKNGKIAYDFPECIPKYVKNRLRIELNKELLK